MCRPTVRRNRILVRGLVFGTVHDKQGCKILDLDRICSCSPVHWGLGVRKVTAAVRMALLRRLGAWCGRKVGAPGCGLSSTGIN